MELVARIDATVDECIPTEKRPIKTWYAARCIRMVCLTMHAEEDLCMFVVVVVVVVLALLGSKLAAPVKSWVVRQREPSRMISTFQKQRSGPS